MSFPNLRHQSLSPNQLHHLLSLNCKSLKYLILRSCLWLEDSLLTVQHLSQLEYFYFSGWIQDTQSCTPAMFCNSLLKAPRLHTFILELGSYWIAPLQNPVIAPIATSYWDHYPLLEWMSKIISHVLSERLSLQRIHLTLNCPQEKYDDLSKIFIDTCWYSNLPLMRKSGGIDTSCQYAKEFMSKDNTNPSLIFSISRLHGQDSPKTDVVNGSIRMIPCDWDGWINITTPKGIPAWYI
jgi:hypothetical protein